MTNTSTRIIRQDLLHVAEAVAREKNIDKESVIEAMEMALQKAARTKYGAEIDLRVHIDTVTGEITVCRVLTVVEVVENFSTELTVEQAQLQLKGAKIGDEIIDQLPTLDFGRVAAQTAKQVVVQRVRDIEREKQYEEYKDRIGDVINGLIRRIEYGNVYVDLGRGEAILRRDDLIPRETFHVGDRVRAYISDVRQEAKGPQVFLSRTHGQFMAKLFAQEVPEIYDGVIEIKSVARDPGSRAKIAVYTSDASIDPVGSCVGMRGSRVQAVVGELQGEKVDIVLWSSNPATFVVNALAPAEVMKVVMDEEAGRIEVVVPDDQQSLAIGRRGQNVRLASQLTGWTLDILTEKDESEKRSEELKTRSAVFIEALNVDEVVAHLLVDEGFTTIEEVAYVHLDELRSIEGFDEDLAQELQNRAATYLNEKNEKLQTDCNSLALEKELIELEGLTLPMLVKLGQAGIKTLDDFANLAVDEVKEILVDTKIDNELIGALIMKARTSWFDDPTE
jgi:N utilization substance protein A